MGVNIEDDELVKMFNPTLKRRETILFFLIMVINGLIWIDSDIGLDTCARKRWRVEVHCVIFIIIVFAPTPINLNKTLKRILWYENQ